MNTLKESAAGLFDLIFPSLLGGTSASKPQPKSSEPNAARHVAVLAVAISGSLGDTAMQTAVGQTLKAAGIGKMTLLVHDEKERAQFERIGYRVINVGGLFKPVIPMSVIRSLRQVFEECTDLIVIGADVLDGKYSPSKSLRRFQLAGAARRHGLRAGVVNFSFSDKAVPALCDKLRKLDFLDDITLVSREPVSAGRISKVLGREVPASADLAFLLSPTPATEEPVAGIAAKVEAWRAEGRKIIAFNINATRLRKTPDADLARSLGTALDRLCTEIPAAVVFVPHDYRKGSNDEALAKMIAAEMTSQAYYMPDRHYISSDAKAICKMADLTVTGRMHCGIASLGSGTPALFWDYQGKVEGLLNLAGTPGQTFTEDDMIDPDRMVARIAEALEHAPANRAAIAERLPGIKAMSRSNLNFILAPDSAGTPVAAEAAI
ncbi:MAG: polysaccharide pyruvyl transferase family protein [Alteromonadaceae bacterium]|nr:polysaccharide pyruvyl transferase family protein [Alteromonadaceae bacterium]